jgi:NADH-quinone oxidoreductase subunit G
VDWNTALGYVVDGLKRVRAEFGVARIGALAHPMSTSEEMFLLGQLVRCIGSESIDHRLRHSDFSHPPAARRARWLGTSIASLSKLDRVLVIGSFLRKDHPLFAQRIRQAVRHGAQVWSLNALHEDWALPRAGTLTAAPAAWPALLAEVAVAVAQTTGVPAPVAGVVAGDEALALATALVSGERKAVLLGNAAQQHPQAAQLLALAGWISRQVGATVGVLGDGGNAVGAQLVGAMPGPGGLNAHQMLHEPMKALLLLNTEPVLDAADAAQARRALSAGGLIVALTPFKDTAADVADVLLPIAAFTETAGSFVNAEGRLQAFHGVVKPPGDARPGWKVLRVLGNLLGLPGFDFETVEDVRSAAFGTGELAGQLDNSTAATLKPAIASPMPAPALQRIADVPIYHADAVVRRATSLQLTADARGEPVAGLPSALWRQLGLRAGARVLVGQGEAAVVLPAREEPTLAAGTVRLAAGHPLTAGLGAMFGEITVEAVGAA